MIQAKLAVGSAGDRYEQEADQVAAAVMRYLQRSGSTATSVVDDRRLPSTLNRIQLTSVTAVPTSEASDARRRSTKVRRMSKAPSIGLQGGELDTDTDAAIRGASGGGRALDNSIRRPMERSFGVDFSGVRVHLGSRADDLNRRIQARAFTTGSDIFFSKGQYNPSSSSGQELLAHELTHVVQQGGAGVARRPADAQRTGIESTEGGADTTVVESSAGKGRSKITLRGPGGALGSMTVRAVDRTSIEATNLSVTPSERGHGYGSDLIAAAAEVGERSGKSRVTLGSQDNGSGKLDNWYKSLGFRQTGTVKGGYSGFEAPTASLRRASVQRSTAVARITIHGLPAAKSFVAQRMEANTEVDEDTTDYYFDGNPEQYFIDYQDMVDMRKWLDVYMSIELHGVDPTIAQATIISTGWQKFLEIFERIMGTKRHPAVLFLRKTLRNKTKQPEMPAGLTIPEIIEYVKKRAGQVCNQSVGGGILEILGYFKQP